MPCHTVWIYAIRISGVPNSDEAQLAAPGRPLGALLEPALRRACGEHRLSRVHWFRTDWQRGGALTGYATWADEHDTAHRVVAKLPVPPAERRWLARLQPLAPGFPAHASPDEDPARHVVPRLHAHGDTLGGYDLCWVVMERLPHGPLGEGWPGQGIELLTEAAGRFYAAAHAAPGSTPDPGSSPLPGSFPSSAPPSDSSSTASATDWHALLRDARCHFRQRGNGQPLPHAQRWKKALKAADRRLDGWLKLWHARPTDQWCHGDLHPGNAMTRTEPPHGPALLLDFAQVRAGCWVEDAVYLEHLYWARPERLAGHKPARLLARQRRAHGLPVGEDWHHLAQTYRALLAMAAPTRHHRTGDPRHLDAALGILEGCL